MIMYAAAMGKTVTAVFNAYLLSLSMDFLIQYHTVGTGLAPVRNKFHIKSNQRTTARVVPTDCMRILCHCSQKLSYINSNPTAGASPCPTPLDVNFTFTNNRIFIIFL